MFLHLNCNLKLCLKGKIMPDEIIEEVQTPETDNLEVDTPEVAAAEVSETVDPVEAVVQERLAQMKANMDRMSKERDDALKVKNQMEADAKAAKIAQLEKDGKLQEVAEMKIADLEAKLSIYQAENTKLNRDSVLQNALAGLDFKNDRSREMAYKDIVEQLSQTEDGGWRHNSGTSIDDFVAGYSKSEDNSFLFRVKSNTGSGAANNAGVSNISQKKSMSEMSTSEMLAAAEKGQLGSFNL
jgi:hypothetical protein